LFHEVVLGCCCQTRKESEAQHLISGYNLGRPSNVFLTFLALRIHLSEEAEAAIKQFPGYDVEPRGQTYVKVISAEVSRFRDGEVCSNVKLLAWIVSQELRIL
jgi:hypothetical protein